MGRSDVTLDIIWLMYVTVSDNLGNRTGASTPMAKGPLFGPEVTRRNV